MLAIYKREMRAYFCSPLGYIFLAVVFCFGGQAFGNLLFASSSNIGFIFSYMLQVVMIIMPILTMRLLSEEKKQKTDQLLMTAPVKVHSIVVGKFLAAFTMFMIGVASTIVYVTIIATFTKPNWNIFLGNLLALILLGGSLLAIGLFISALTENQMVSAIISFALMMIILLFDSLAAQIPVKAISGALMHLSFTSRYQDLVSGILDVSHIIFFVSVMIVFIYLTVKALERKRWS